MKQPTIRWLMIVLASTTAVVHLALGLQGVFGGSPDMVMFILNGLGYFALLAALFVPSIPFFSARQPLTHYLMIGYTALTFALYFALNGFTGWSFAAAVSKLAEFLLVVVTFINLRHLSGASN